MKVQKIKSIIHLIMGALALVATPSCMAMHTVKKEAHFAEPVVVEEVPEQKNTILQPFASNVLFIFLDDTEETLDAISEDLASALLQEAGPIIASATAFVNAKKMDIPEEKDPEKLLAKLNDIDVRSDDVTTEERDEQSRILLLEIGFDTHSAQQWIIKEISPFLYLFIPKKYLQAKKISTEEVATFVSTPLFITTEIEQALGLRVNHMKTVTLDVIKKPNPKTDPDRYFVKELNRIFVTNGNYPAQNRAAIPTWALYMGGHGSRQGSIVGLALQQFKRCLDFFEEKINIKLLYYSSCHAAGLNAETLYKNDKTAIYRTYPFAIITQALTDATTKSIAFSMYVQADKLHMKMPHEFIDFAKMVTTSDVIDYRALAEPFLPNVQTNGLGSLPQIKFPGLPWFSVIDTDKVIVIGSIMAKSRTVPLDIATFFQKNSTSADPLGILLYASHVPFELVVDTKKVPTFISMIPGDAVHRIKKISSTVHTADDILNHFYVEGLAPHKVFVIDNIEAPFSVSMRDIETVEGAALQDILVDVTGEHVVIYFTYDDEVYRVVGHITEKNPPRRVSVEKEQKYRSLLAQYGGKKKSNTAVGALDKTPERKVEKKIDDIESRSVHQLLTPEAIAKINEAQEKKRATGNK
jgi:hypothetical protein